MFVISNWKHEFDEDGKGELWYRSCEDTCPVIITRYEDKFVVEVSMIMGDDDDRYICPISSNMETCKNLDVAKITAVVMARSEGFTVLEL